MRGESDDWNHIGELLGAFAQFRIIFEAHPC